MYQSIAECRKKFRNKKTCPIIGTFAKMVEPSPVLGNDWAVVKLHICDLLLLIRYWKPAVPCKSILYIVFMLVLHKSVRICQKLIYFGIYFEHSRFFYVKSSLRPCNTCWKWNKFMWTFCSSDHSECWCYWRRGWRDMGGMETTAAGVVCGVLFAVDVGENFLHCETCYVKNMLG